MKRLLLAAMIAFASPAMAQAPQEFILKVKPVDVDKIGKGLAKLPFEEVAELMQVLRQQIMEQQQPAKPIEPPQEKK